MYMCVVSSEDFEKRCVGLSLESQLFLELNNEVWNAFGVGRVATKIDRAQIRVTLQPQRLAAPKGDGVGSVDFAIRRGTAVLHHE